MRFAAANIVVTSRVRGHIDHAPSRRVIISP